MIDPGPAAYIVGTTLSIGGGVVAWLLRLQGHLIRNKATAAAQVEAVAKDSELAITKTNARIEAVAAAAELASTKAHGRMDVVETRQTNMEGDVREIKMDVKTLLGRV